MNKFYVIIYHPSRFVSLIHLNVLIYRRLCGVIDTSKMEKSITLSITIWGYPSRFSHYTLYQLQIFLLTLTMAIRHGFMEWNILFHTMKLFVSSGETLRFILWNEPIRLVPASAICKGFCFTRKQIRFLLHNDQQKNVRDNPKSWWIAWWIL